MNRLQRYIHSYHPIVHILMVGTVFTFLTSSMSMPFLAIYLHQTVHLDPPMIGLILGAGPLAATFGGFIGGVLSDLMGRQRLMLMSLGLLALSFVGFVYTANPLLLMGLSIMRGISGAFFSTISKALMGDLTPENMRFRMFANRYFAINLGFSIGPMLGALLGIGASTLAFFLTACVYLVYLAVLALSFKKVILSEQNQPSEDRMTIASAFNVIRNDRILFLFLVGGILLTTVHGQMSVTLSQYLEANLEKGIQLFGVLMSLNGFTVLLMQIPLTRFSERFTLFQRMIIGCMLFAAGNIGFALSAGWAGFIVAMLVYTFGEIIVVPSEYAQLDQITPHGMRGTYYGAQGFNEFGSFLGPWVGGMILTSYGGPAMFLFFAALSMISLIFYGKGRSMYEQKQLNIVQDNTLSL
ncbi:MDR family MFS transporter [Brevibacillus ginsengisoli]|uniref:MDR family MFS transporter n=1 Tax=Brevibacillus ginsengisoli TaxID=363854 RepID=UPI003CFA531C